MSKLRRKLLLVGSLAIGGPISAQTAASKTIPESPVPQSPTTLESSKEFRDFGFHAPIIEIDLAVLAGRPTGRGLSDLADFQPRPNPTLAETLAHQYPGVTNKIISTRRVIDKTHLTIRRGHGLHGYVR